MLFHHLGHATRTLDRSRATLKALGYQCVAAEIHDVKLGVLVEFWHSPNAPMIELLQPADPSSPLVAILRQRSGPYHYCFSAESFEEVGAWVLETRARMLTPPLDAVAFPQRKIQFFGVPDGSIFELVWPA